MRNRTGFKMVDDPAQVKIPGKQTSPPTLKVFPRPPNVIPRSPGRRPASYRTSKIFLSSFAPREKRRGRRLMERRGGGGRAVMFRIWNEKRPLARRTEGEVRKLGGNSRTPHPHSLNPKGLVAVRARVPTIPYIAHMLAYVRGESKGSPPW